MKKITFILLALISGTASAQSSSTETADVRAEIVSPIEITAGDDLDFGTIAVSSEAGKVRVTHDNTVTYSAPGMKLPTSTAHAATFTIKAPAGTNYSISIPSVELSNTGGDIMEVTFEHNLADINTGGSEVALGVGGLLSVNANQTAGTYEGEVSVTVSYE